MFFRMVTIALLSVLTGAHQITLSARGQVRYVENGVIVRTYWRALEEAESAARHELAAKMATMQMDSAAIHDALFDATITAQRIRIDRNVAEVDMQLTLPGR